MIDTVAKYRAAIRQARELQAEAMFGDGSFTCRVSKKDALLHVRGFPGSTPACEFGLMETFGFWARDEVGGKLIIG